MQFGTHRQSVLSNFLSQIHRWFLLPSCQSLDKSSTCSLCQAHRQGGECGRREGRIGICARCPDLGSGCPLQRCTPWVGGCEG